MKLKINSKDFQAKFIAPILEVNKTNKSPIQIDTDGNLFCVSTIEGDRVWLYNTYKPVEMTDQVNRFNINLTKLKGALSCLNNKESGFVELSINHESLNYKGDDLKFNIRLLDNNVVEVKRFNIEVLKTLQYTFSTKIPKIVMNDIKRAMDFASETEKFYLELEDSKLYFMFGDKNENHTDTIKVLITDAFTGTIGENIYDISILRFVLKFQEDVEIKIAENGVLVLHVNQENSQLNYITTKLKK